MDADEQHVGAVVEDGLRAVAVVVVDIQHRHARCAAVAQGLRGHGGVVEKAVAAHEVRACVVARRARGAEAGPLAFQERLCRAGSGIGARLGCRPGAGAQGAAVVHRIQAQAGREVLRLNVAAQGAHRPGGGEGLLIGIGGAQRQPLIPRAAQKFEITRCVHLAQHGRAVDIGCVQHVAACAQRLLDKHRTAGRFKTRHAVAAKDFVARVVAGLAGVGEDAHEGVVADGHAVNHASYPRAG